MTSSSRSALTAPKAPAPSSADLSRATRDLMDRLAALGTPERAEQERAYLRHEQPHLGVPVPDSRRVIKDVLRTLPGLDGPGTIAFADQLWREPFFEGRRSAVEVLILRSALLVPADMSVVERLVRDSDTWALVDGLAVHVAGAVFSREPAECGPILDRWAQDPDFWVRRTAVLALLPGVRAGHPDLERFGRYADGMLEEKEFFIRKALGWALREISRRDPDFVVGWVGPRVARTSGVTLREAVRRLPEGDRDKLLAAYRER